MTDLLDRIRQELSERLEQSRAAVREYEQLQNALSALNGDDASRPLRGRQSAEPVPRPRARAQGARPPGRKRAPRGANREAVLHALAERLGASASELAAASEVRQATLYNLLRSLKQRGEIASVQLPSGSTGYRLTPTTDRQGTDQPAPSAGSSSAGTAEGT
jgi:DNA invertase Pin-like site-specific DNA recombinase